MICTRCGATAPKLIPDYVGCAECAPVTDRAALLYATARARLIAAEEICDALAGMEADLTAESECVMASRSLALLKDMRTEVENRKRSVAALRAIFEEDEFRRIEALWDQAVANSDAAETGANGRRRRHRALAEECCGVWGMPWPPEKTVEPEADSAGMLASALARRRGLKDGSHFGK